MSKKIKIFLSRSFNKNNDDETKDQEKIKKIKRRLKSCGFKLCEDKPKKSKNKEQWIKIWDRIKEKIKDCSFMLVLYSETFEKGKGGKGLKEKDSKSEQQPSKGWIYKEIKEALKYELDGIIVAMPDKIFQNKFENINCKDEFKKIPPIILKNYNNKRIKYLKNNDRENLECSYIPIINLSDFIIDANLFLNQIKKRWKNRRKYKVFYG